MDQLSAVLENGLTRLESAETLEALEVIRVELLGRKGVLADAGKSMGKLAPEERAAAGKLLNAAKQQLESVYVWILNGWI